MPQLQINQGPQDALLYDNSKSYFTNVGYVRTSNFQVEYRNVQPQNTAAFNSTVQYVIPKAADLLGPVDLVVDLKPPSTGFTKDSTVANSVGTRVWNEWVDELGFAMIDKITFSCGSNDIETITGEMLQIRNELMTSDENRLGFDTIQKTGRRAFAKKNFFVDGEHNADADELPGVTGKRYAKDYSRISSLYYNDDASSNEIVESTKRKLTIPLGLFFTKHVSQYFPLAAVAGCNDVRISIKFRALNELMKLSGVVAAADTGTIKPDTVEIDKAELMCHYVHVTGPEATTLMNREHVRLLKLFQHQHKVFSNEAHNRLEMDLSFLHPVTTLLITIRRNDDLNTVQNARTRVATSGALSTLTKAMFDSASKGFFFYHGDGIPPNYDAAEVADELEEQDVKKILTLTSAGTDVLTAGEVAEAVDSIRDPGTGCGTVKLESIQLTLNGQERHPGLDKGIPVDYLKSRLLPMLHSNSDLAPSQLRASSGSVKDDQIYQLKGSKNIFVYPFSLNPEGSQPSGAVNFSKVSHAKLTLHLAEAVANTPTEATRKGAPGTAITGSGLRVDVYGLHYNWLQIKDGRALLSFA